MAKQTTITVETSSLLILLGRISCRAWCPQCAAEGEMIAVDNTNVISNLDQRAVEQWLHSGELHRVNALDGSSSDLPKIPCWLVYGTPTWLTAASRGCRIQKRREYEIQIASQFIERIGRSGDAGGTGRSSTLVAQHLKGARAPDRFPHYVVQDLGTLGGPYSFSYNLNNAGVVSGGSATAAQNGDPSQAVVNAPQTAFLWDHGHIRNLGTLGGPDSEAAAASAFDWAAVDSETANLSRQGEDVCRFGNSLQCLAAIWKYGRLSPLPLLPGSNNTYALDMNDRGQVVGFSDTDV